MISLTLPIRTVSEANSRGHWSRKAKRAKEQRMAVGLALIPKWQAWLKARVDGLTYLRILGSDIPCPLAVTMTRIAPCSLDDDNAASAFKATRDAIAEVMGVDDRDPRVEWRVQQERGKVREYAVRIEIGART